jgi:predicted nucleic acid-binding protein
MTVDARLDCVVDASVGIKFFLKEPLSERADTLFSYLSYNPTARLYVPNLFFIECANILWKHVRRFQYPVDVAQQHIADLVKLPLRSVALEDLVDDALALATQYGCSAYDAAYVTLAEQLSLPLVTADMGLIRMFSQTEFDIYFLGDWPVA